jgi:hypothetical protein
MSRKHVIKTYNTIPLTLTIILGKEKTLMTLTIFTMLLAAESSYLLKPLKPLIITLERVLPLLNNTQEKPAPVKDTQPEALANSV